jgi:stromal membrane-associated protein
MKEMGNIKSNAIYNPDPKRHPPPATVSDERDSEIQKFIRRKYELGAFKAGAGRDLASASVNSRTQAMQSRGLAPPSSTTPPPDTNRALPSLPAGPSRRPARSNSNAPVWTSLGPSNTGSSSSSSSNSLAPPVTPAALPPRSASHSSPNQAPALLKPNSQPPQQRDLLVDVNNSSSSTRPLQLAGFPTVPAAPAVNPLPSPIGPAPSPLALGQQAFFQQFSPTAAPTQNPFAMQYGQTLSPMGAQYMQQSQMGNQLGMNGMGMSMGMGGMMGSSPNGMSLQQGMMASPTGMGMNGHMMGGGMGSMGMGGVQMAQPVQYQQQQYWQSGYM